MLKRCVGVVFIVVLLLSGTEAALADSFTFTTVPSSGDVSGAAGSTVGWGYSITNQSLADWLLTTNFSADPFLNGTPNSLFDFPILPPGATVNVPFDVVNGFGLYELNWDAGVPVGFTTSGFFDVSADWYDGDPFAGGNFLASAIDQTAAFSATVSPASSVSEPSSLALLVAGLAAGLAAIYAAALKKLRQARSLPIVQNILLFQCDNHR